MVKKFNGIRIQPGTLDALGGVDDALVKLQREQAEVEALQRQIGMTRDIEEYAKLQREAKDLAEYGDRLGTGRLPGTGIYRQLNPTAFDVFEQMNQKAIDDAKFLGERTVIEIPIAPMYDFQAAERDRRERDREHAIETARLAKIAELEAEAEFKARPQQPAPADATLDAPTPAVNSEPITESKPERNLRWLNHFEAEERSVKRGAYNRTAAHFNEKSSTLRKAVDKARADRTATKRAGIKAVEKKGKSAKFWPEIPAKKTTKPQR